MGKIKNFRFSVRAGIIVVAILPLLIPGALQNLFSPGFFMPHKHCYLDDTRMIWLQGLSDFLIAISYMAIAGALTWLVSKAREDLPFKWMFFAFGLFIFSCGWTHFMEVWTLWHPTYWLSGIIKAITAIASLATAVGTFLLMPHVFELIKTAKASEQRRQDLEKAHQALERAYKELQAFSYSLSHDIRAPLRAISSFSAIVLDEHRDKLAGSGAMLLGKVVEASKRMDRLVEDVLALSRVGRGGMQNQTIDLEELMNQIIQERPELQAPKAYVEVQSPLPKVQGDNASLTQCMANLLGNAVKYVAPGVTPRVKVYADRTVGMIRIWVEDNGLGIPPDAREKIFEPFQRLHTQEEYEGSGIGLAIVHKAVERMGGKVGVESEVDHGSRFWVELKAAGTTVAPGAET